MPIAAASAVRASKSPRYYRTDEPRDRPASAKPTDCSARCASSSAPNRPAPIARRSTACAAVLVRALEAPARPSRRAARRTDGGPRPGGVAGRGPARAAARPLRHGLAGRPARAHADRRTRRPAVRAGRARHEGRPGDWRSRPRGSLAAERCRPVAPARHDCSRRPTRKSAARRRGPASSGSRARARPCSCSNRRCPAAR